MHLEADAGVFFLKETLPQTTHYESVGCREHVKALLVNGCSQPGSETWQLTRMCSTLARVPASAVAPSWTPPGQRMKLHLPCTRFFSKLWVSALSLRVQDLPSLLSKVDWHDLWHVKCYHMNVLTTQNMIFFKKIAFLLTYCLCVCSTACMWMPEDRLWEWVLSFYPLGLRALTQVGMPGGGLFYLLSLSTGPRT